MRRQPKLIFINVENYPSHVAPLAAFGYMAACLKEHLDYHDIRQLNLVYDEPEPLKKILAAEPDVVGFRTITSHIKQVEQLSKTLREEYGIPVIWGGPHINSVPSLTPDYIDCAVIGEGEITIVELMRHFLATGRFDKDHLGKIKGLAYWHNGEFCQTPPRPQITDLSTIPCPDYTICDDECFTPRERWVWLGQPVVGIPYLTARACAFRCIFCQPATYEGKLRASEFDKVFADLKILRQRHGAEVFAMYDPIFANHAKRVRDFYDGAKAHGMLDTFFYIQLFARNFNEDMARELQRLKMYRIFFGLESGSDKIIKYLKNGVCSVEDNRRVCQLSEKYNLRTEAAFMIGVPGETEEDLELTYDFIRKEYLTYVQISHTVPQPGTKLWSDAEKLGIIKPGFDWDDLEPKGTSSDVDDKLIYLNPGLPKEIYLKHSRRLYKLARRKTKAGNARFKKQFASDLDRVREKPAANSLQKWFSRLGLPIPARAQ
jgi:anaerobic magnesium-protoporphyrin IX monomethyl ester cyclase